MDVSSTMNIALLCQRWTLLGCARGAAKSDKLDVLVALVANYEARRWPTERERSFDPSNALSAAGSPRRGIRPEHRSAVDGDRAGWRHAAGRVTPHPEGAGRGALRALRAAPTRPAGNSRYHHHLGLGTDQTFLMLVATRSNQCVRSR